MTLLFCIISAFDYSLLVEANLFYDDNIFAYAQKYLDEFMAQLHPERFPFETYDDLITNLDFGLLLRNRFIKNHFTTCNLKITSYSYLINQEKDYQIFSGGARQSFGKLAVKFEYLFIPSYLIRYYKDPLGESYIGCEFTEHLFLWKNVFAPNQLMFFSITLKKEIDDYIKNFDVYDSRAKRLEFEVNFALSKFFEPGIAYEFKDSKAKGPVPDISYHEHIFNLSNLFRLKLPRLSKIVLDYQLKYRVFTTEVSPLLDSPHSGRLDVGHLFKFGWEFPVFTALNFSLGYSYELRNSYSDVYTEIGEYRDYKKWMISSGLEFQY